MLHAIEAEHTQPIAQVTMADHIPEPYMIDQAIRVNGAFGLVGAACAVAHPDTPLLPGSGTKCEDHRASWRRHVGLRRDEIEDEGLLNRLYAFTQGCWQHAVNFSERAFAGWRSYGQAEPPGSQQAESERQGLIFGKHQWGQFEAGEQAIGAIAPALGLDRNAEVLQHGNVAAHAADIDFQALGQLWPTYLPVGLQQFQHSQHTRGWMVHDSFSSPRVRVSNQHRL